MDIQPIVETNLFQKVRCAFLIGCNLNDDELNLFLSMLFKVKTVSQHYGFCINILKLWKSACSILNK